MKSRHAALCGDAGGILDPGHGVPGTPGSPPGSLHSPVQPFTGPAVQHTLLEGQ